MDSTEVAILKREISKLSQVRILILAANVVGAVVMAAVLLLMAHRTQWLFLAIVIASVFMVEALATVLFWSRVTHIIERLRQDLAGREIEERHCDVFLDGKKWAVLVAEQCGLTSPFRTLTPEGGEFQLLMRLRPPSGSRLFISFLPASRHILSYQVKQP